MSSLLDFMIIGIGIDLVEVGRIEKAMARWDGAFERRVFTEQELVYCMDKKRPAEHLAARFAAKEAVMKAFGTGLSGGVTWKDAQVVRDEKGKPGFVLTGRLNELAMKMGVGEAMLSLSHDKSYAVAQVVLVGGI